MSKIPNLPLNMPQEHRKFLQRVKEVLEETPFAASPPPGPPSVPRVNPLPGGNKITFTGGTGANGHFILVSPVPKWDPTKPDNHLVDIGASTVYTDVVGQAAVTRYYWVGAYRGTQKSIFMGPTKGVTLALGTPAANTPGTSNLPGNLTRGPTGQPVIVVGGHTIRGNDLP